MKNIAILLIMNFTIINTMAQYVGIGTASPLQKLHVDGGNLLITQKVLQAGNAPTGGQTYTMLNAAALNYPASDSTGKVYDPGGAAGNYLPGLTAAVNIPLATNCIGFEVTISAINLGSLDSLIISDLPGWQNVHLRVGNNYNTTGTYTFSTPRLYLTFKSNSDASVGTGFELIFKRKYRTTGENITNSVGNVMYFETSTSTTLFGPFRNSTSLGNYSFSAGTSQSTGSYGASFGILNEAGGEASFAANSANKAYGAASAAFGYMNSALANRSFVAGSNLETSTIGSAAFGEWNDPYESSGGQDASFMVGNGGAVRSNALAVFPDGNTHLNGFTRLGKLADGAPSIKMKKITGYTLPGTNETWVFIPSGLSNMNKILSFQVIVTNGIYQFIPNTTHPGSYFRTNIDGTNIAVGTMSGQSSFLYNMPIKVLITYEE